MTTVVIDPSPEIIKEMAARVLERMGLGDFAHPEVAVGRAAARDGLSLADCPYAPADPAGRYWRIGWVDATAIDKRH